MACRSSGCRSANIYWPWRVEERHDAVSRTLFHVTDSLNLLMAGAVKEAVRRFSPQLVLSNQMSCFSALSWRTLRLAGVPALHSLRDFYLLCPRTTMFRDDRRCVTQCASCNVLAYPRKLMSQHVAGLTGVSEFMIDYHRRRGLFEKALVLPAILSAVRPPASVPARLTAPPEGIRHFGYIGRVEPEKGLDLLLDGLLTLPAGSWRLSIAGTGSVVYREALQARCAGLPVEFLGFVPAETFYSVVDVVVIPSIWEEPLPRAALEAFSYGLTVIASDRGGIPDVVRPGATGYLVDLDEPAQMAAAMLRATQVPEEGRGFGARGRDLVVSRTQAVVAADYEAASEQVIMFAAATGKSQLQGAGA